METDLNEKEKEDFDKILYQLSKPLEKTIEMLNVFIMSY